MMNTKELIDKLEELIKNNPELAKARLVFRCYNEKGEPQDIDIYDTRAMYETQESEEWTYCLQTFIIDSYNIKINRKRED